MQFLAVIADTIVFGVFKNWTFAFAIEKLDLSGKSCSTKFVDSISANHADFANEINCVQSREICSQGFFRSLEHQPFHNLVLARVTQQCLLQFSPFEHVETKTEKKPRLPRVALTMCEQPWADFRIAFSALGFVSISEIRVRTLRLGVLVI